VTTEIKFRDKLRGLELLAKLKGLLKPEVKVEAGDSWKAVLLRMNAEDETAKAREAEGAAGASLHLHRPPPGQGR